MTAITYDLILFEISLLYS